MSIFSEYPGLCVSAICMLGPGVLIYLVVYVLGPPVEALYHRYRERQDRLRRAAIDESLAKPTGGHAYQLA